MEDIRCKSRFFKEFKKEKKSIHFLKIKTVKINEKPTSTGTSWNWATLACTSSGSIGTKLADERSVWISSIASLCFCSATSVKNVWRSSRSNRVEKALFSSTAFGRSNRWANHWAHSTVLIVSCAFGLDTHEESWQLINLIASSER